MKFEIMLATTMGITATLAAAAVSIAAVAVSIAVVAGVSTMLMTQNNSNGAAECVIKRFLPVILAAEELYS